MSKFLDKYVVPVLLPLVLLGIIVVAFAVIGEAFLGVYQAGETKDRLDRPELWIGIGILVVVIALMSFLASRPQGALGALDRDVVFGRRAIGSDQLPPVDSTKLRGEPGTVADIAAGYTLYARSGALARVVGILPGGTDYGKRFSGFFYAEGLGHAAKELWIPFEAVTAVYPETRSAFLAIKGDETESFGWTSPPESMTRGVSKHQSASDKIK